MGRVLGLEGTAHAHIKRFPKDQIAIYVAYNNRCKLFVQLTAARLRDCYPGAPQVNGALLSSKWLKLGEPRNLCASGMDSGPEVPR